MRKFVKINQADLRARERKELMSEIRFAIACMLIVTAAVYFGLKGV